MNDVIMVLLELFHLIIVWILCHIGSIIGDVLSTLSLIFYVTIISYYHIQFLKLHHRNKIQHLLFVFVCVRLMFATFLVKMYCVKMVRNDRWRAEIPSLFKMKIYLHAHLHKFTYYIDTYRLLKSKSWDQRIDLHFIYMNRFVFNWINLFLPLLNKL
jgi:hypothetical protein